MLCQKCNKKEASVHLKRIVNGKKEELHLCKECAVEKGQFDFNDNNLSFQTLLSGILNNKFNSNNNSLFKKLKSPTLSCKNCGKSYEEFTKSGLFGCAECYQVFQDELEPLFKRIHGSLRHMGKRPALIKEKIEAETEIDSLKNQMQKAVAKENFEKAAELRDRIHAIEKDMEAD